MKSKFRITWKRGIFLFFIVLLVMIGRPVAFLIYTSYKDKDPVNIESPGYANDASKLNKTKIDELVKVPEDLDKATEQIALLIQQAKTEGKKISIAGAQHSMGGHTIYDGGILLDMKGFHYMQLDTAQNILTVGSGALWSEVIPYLDKYRRSVAVMQSNNSFSVGGSISVNCHGWQPNSPPISSTVESFRLINSEGQVVNCSRTENAELFHLVLGGYGLFGVILDVRLRVVPNKMYMAKLTKIKSEDYTNKFLELTDGRKDIGMVYGRINVNPDHYMEEGIISTFIIDSTTVLQPLGEGRFTALRRTVFRGSANSAYGKNLRWRMEKFMSSWISGREFSRNQLLNESVEVFENSDTVYTDILHEYFIPRDSVSEFIKGLKKIIPQHKVDLLNITVRNVKTDQDAYLRYANEEVFGFVMLFNQAKNNEAEIEMKSLTQELVDLAISLRGTYYLPYSLHATKEQMYKAYPQAKSFFELKKKYDPQEVFQNFFYTTYK